MTAPEQMRACPFCGSDEHLSMQKVGSLTADMPDRPYRVVCTHLDHDTVTGPVAYGRLEAIAAWNTRPAPAELVEAQWQPIETAPEGNEETGPFFDVIWAGKNHRYLPVPARQIDCYRKRGSIKKQHGYPAVTTVFLDKPTHWMPRPDAPAALRNAGAAS